MKGGRVKFDLTAEVGNAAPHIKSGRLDLVVNYRMKLVVSCRLNLVTHCR
jgi:hypothetical protein